MQDTTLIEAVRSGNAEAFDALIRMHQPAVYGYLRARLLQPSDADDIAQEVFLRFFLGRARFDSKQLIRPWLLGIARNILKEHTRLIRRERDKERAWTKLCLELEELLPHTQIDETEPDPFLTRLPDCLNGLGQSARQAIEWYYSDKLRLAEIGSRLRRSEGAVKLLVFRARQALKRCIDQEVKVTGTPAESAANDQETEPPTP